MSRFPNAFRHPIFKSFAALSVLAGAGLPATADTVAWWRFEEGVPNTRAAGVGSVFDLSGSYLNGTPFDFPMYRATEVPESWLGLEFNGGNRGTQRVFVPDGPMLYLTHSLTLEAFVRYDGIPTAGTHASQIVFRGDSRDALDPYTLAIANDGRLFLDISSLTERVQLYSPTPIPMGQYIHVAGVLDDTTGEMRLFVNGIQVATKITDVRPFDVLTGPDPGVGIGNVQSDNSNQAFGGVIDEVRISNVALSPSQFLNGGKFAVEDMLAPGITVLHGPIAPPNPVLKQRRRK